MKTLNTLKIGESIVAQQSELDKQRLQLREDIEKLSQEIGQDRSGFYGRSSSQRLISKRAKLRKKLKVVEKELKQQWKKESGK